MGLFGSHQKHQSCYRVFVLCFQLLSVNCLWCELRLFCVNVMFSDLSRCTMHSCLCLFDCLNQLHQGFCRIEERMTIPQHAWHLHFVFFMLEKQSLTQGFSNFLNPFISSLLFTDSISLFRAEWFGSTILSFLTVKLG